MTEIFVDDGAADAVPTAQRPVLFRLPKPGTVDPFFGANRSFWNERILPTPRNNHRPEVKSLVVRKKGALKGCRFILYESARQFFETLAKEQGLGGGR